VLFRADFITRIVAVQDHSEPIGRPAGSVHNRSGQQSQNFCGLFPLFCSALILRVEKAIHSCLDSSRRRFDRHRRCIDCHNHAIQQLHHKVPSHNVRRYRADHKRVDRYGYKLQGVIPDSFQRHLQGHLRGSRLCLPGQLPAHFWRRKFHY